MLNQTIQLLQQALQNLQYMYTAEESKFSPQPSRQPQNDPIPEEFKELVPYSVEIPGKKISQKQCTECVIKTMEQFRFWRAAQCSKSDTFEDVLSSHNQYYYRILRQQIYKFIVITDGFRYSRGEANEKIAHCPFCKFENLLTYVTAHVLKKHANNYQIYNCSICNKDFQSHRLLIMHIHNYHKEGVTPKKRKTKIEQLQYESDENVEYDEEEEQDEDRIFVEADSPEIQI